MMETAIKEDFTAEKLNSRSIIILPNTTATRRRSSSSRAAFRNQRVIPKGFRTFRRRRRNFHGLETYFQVVEERTLAPSLRYQITEQNKQIAKRGGRSSKRKTIQSFQYRGESSNQSTSTSNTSVLPFEVRRENAMQMNEVSSCLGTSGSSILVPVETQRDVKSISLHAIKEIARKQTPRRARKSCDSNTSVFPFEVRTENEMQLNEVLDRFGRTSDPFILMPVEIERDVRCISLHATKEIARRRTPRPARKNCENISVLPFEVRRENEMQMNEVSSHSGRASESSILMPVETQRDVRSLSLHATKEIARRQTVRPASKIFDSNTSVLPFEARSENEMQMNEVSSGLGRISESSILMPIETQRDVRSISLHATKEIARRQRPRSACKNCDSNASLLPIEVQRENVMQMNDVSSRLGTTSELSILMPDETQRDVRSISLHVTKKIAREQRPRPAHKNCESNTSVLSIEVQSTNGMQTNEVPTRLGSTSESPILVPVETQRGFISSSLHATKEIARRKTKSPASARKKHEPQAINTARRRRARAERTAEQKALEQARDTARRKKARESQTSEQRALVRAAENERRTKARERRTKDQIEASRKLNTAYQRNRRKRQKQFQQCSDKVCDSGDTTTIVCENPWMAISNPFKC